MKNIPTVSVVIPTHNRKAKLVRLIRSVLASNYPTERLEIIVVDDFSSDGTQEEVRSLFPMAKIIRNNSELLISGSRNVGLHAAKGEYFFLVDDDNVVDKLCISKLIEVFEMNSSSTLGIVGPIMYYLKQPNRIWCAGIRRNMITSKTELIGKDEIDVGQFSELLFSKDFPNSFMIKKEIIDAVGIFDAKNFPIHYEEADFGERTRKAGFGVVCAPKAKIWHDIPLPGELENGVRAYHIQSSMRAYYAGRNRILFQRKYSRSWQFLIFVLIVNWLFTAYYINMLLFGHGGALKKENINLAKNYLKGVSDGLWPLKPH